MDAGASGRPNLHVLEKALALNAGGSAGTKSPHEDAFLALLRFAGIPEPRVNTQLLGEEVDCHWPERKLVVEVDGSGHGRERTQRDDARRDTAAPRGRLESPPVQRQRHRAAAPTSARPPPGRLGSSTVLALDAHPHARAVLGAALKGEPAHAYLLHGPAGSGKREAARAFAGELLARGAKDPENARTRAEHGAHPDLTWVTPSGAHEMLRRDVDEAVVAAAAHTPFEASHRIFVLERVGRDERRGGQRAAEDARGAAGATSS